MLPDCLTYTSGGHVYGNTRFTIHFTLMLCSRPRRLRCSVAKLRNRGSSCPVAGGIPCRATRLSSARSCWGRLLFHEHGMHTSLNRRRDPLRKHVLCLDGFQIVSTAPMPPILYLHVPADCYPRVPHLGEDQSKEQLGRGSVGEWPHDFFLALNFEGVPHSRLMERRKLRRSIKICRGCTTHWREQLTFRRETIATVRGSASGRQHKVLPN